MKQLYFLLLLFTPQLKCADISTMLERLQVDEKGKEHVRHGSLSYSSEPDADDGFLVGTAYRDAHERRLLMEESCAEPLELPEPRRMAALTALLFALEPYNWHHTNAAQEKLVNLSRQVSRKITNSTTEHRVALLVDTNGNMVIRRDTPSAIPSLTYKHRDFWLGEQPTTVQIPFSSSHLALGMLFYGNTALFVNSYNPTQYIVAVPGGEGILYVSNALEQETDEADLLENTMILFRSGYFQQNHPTPPIAIPLISHKTEVRMHELEGMTGHICGRQIPLRNVLIKGLFQATTTGINIINGESTAGEHLPIIPSDISEIPPESFVVNAPMLTYWYCRTKGNEKTPDPLPFIVSQQTVDDLATTVI